MAHRKMTITRVCHIITGLSRGGAQRMLYYLLRDYDRERFKMTVVSLTELGAVGEQLRDIGVETRALMMNRMLPNPLKVGAIVSQLRRESADIAQTWLYHGDLIGGLAGRMAGVPVLWNLRQSDLDPQTTKRSTLLTAKACAVLSRWLPDGIVCCSHASQRVHGEMGYESAGMVVIGNGVDIEMFRPDKVSATALRREIDVQPSSRLIGLVGRFHPQKDHHTFVKAAGLLHETHPDTRFVLCGEGVDESNTQLMNWISDHAMADHFHLVGERSDIPRVTNLLDIATSSSSYAEGFPNVLAEAMACGIPCVATDSGDSALIVGKTGTIVPRRDPEALAAAWRAMLDLPDEDRRQLGQAARQRAVDTFRLQDVVERYQTLYEKVAQGAKSKA
jgi:glycosyltransferase involved in cell wall biosynthesis